MNWLTIMNNEIDPNAPTTALERVCGGLGLLSWLIGLLLVGALCGCKSFYENSGSSVRVGTLTAPIEVSDGTDSFSCRLLYSMDGAYAYTRKDSKVTVIYDNTYTNTYIGCVNTAGKQHLQVDVEPLYVGEEASTNAVQCSVPAATAAGSDATATNTVDAASAPRQ